MQLGMVGLGRMGANLVRRLMRAGHECVVYDVSADAVNSLVNDGAAGSGSLEEFVQKLNAPKAAWVMVPAGELTEKTVHDLAATDGPRRHDHRRRQHLLPRRHPPREELQKRASTTSTAARAAGYGDSTGATA